MTEGEELKAVTIPGELYAFLMGEGEIDGTSFGDLNANLPGRFWWRALLRTAANTRTPTATPSDEVVEEFLHELAGWERAYPLSMFPEPDMRKAAELLKAGGITLDAISASNMRHVVSQIAPKARAAIAALSAIEGEKK